ncbi:MAG: PD-(D/E)XK nuclease family protein [Bacilli bacterium]
MKNSIIICPNYIKNKILEENKFLDCKLMSITEFIEKYIYKYKSSTLYYLANKYNMNPDNANVILKNLYFVDCSGTAKINYLLEIKKDLLDNGFLIFNNNFKTFIKNKKIIINGYPKTKYYQKIFSIVSNEIIYENELNKKKEKQRITEFFNIEDEVINVAEQITDLLTKTNIDKIKINLVDSVYYESINKIFGFYNIPYNLNNKISLYYLDEVKIFYKNIDKNIQISELTPYLKSLSLSQNIYNQIINIINKYVDINPVVKDFYDILIYELKNTFLIKDKYKNIVDFIDIFNYDIKDDEYYFIMGFNQNCLPVIHKNEDYLSDNELKLLNIDTSYDKNIVEKEHIISIINKTANLFLSYKLQTPFFKYTVSNLIDEINYEIVTEQYKYDNQAINDLLLASRLDNLIKYGIKSLDIFDLYTNCSITYNNYNNTFKKIEELKKETLENFNLSTTNMEMFFQCQFKFYLSSILKIKPFEETLSMKIGNLFHKVLQIVYQQQDVNYEKIIDETILTYFQEPLTKKQIFYNNKYKHILLNLILIINKQLSNSKYQNTYLEEWFDIKSSNDNDIKIVGKIDKVMTFNDDNNTYAVVIDYKTGGLHNDFNKVIYGLDMQLLVYLYLLKSKISNPIFTGMYLQPVLYEPIKSLKNKTYNELIYNNSKLNGYTNSLIKLLFNFDSNYANESFINSLKMKKDGDFYAYSKVLSHDQINKLLNIVEKNINEVIKSLKSRDFIINPKKLGGKNISCEFCEFKDICYMTNNDLVNLKEYKNLEFLGGEDNDTK